MNSVRAITLISIPSSIATAADACQVAPYSCSLFNILFQFCINSFNLCSHPKLILLLQCFVFLAMEMLSNIILCMISFLVCFYFIINDNITTVNDLADLTKVISQSANKNRRRMVENSLRRFIIATSNEISPPAVTGTPPEMPTSPDVLQGSGDVNLTFPFASNASNHTDWNTDEEDNVAQALSQIRKTSSVEECVIEEMTNVSIELQTIDPSDSESHLINSDRCHVGHHQNQEDVYIKHLENTKTNNISEEDVNTTKSNSVVSEVKDVQEVINYFENVGTQHSDQAQEQHPIIIDDCKSTLWNLVNERLDAEEIDPE
ncbi:hypothetical protein WDU94_015114 [Cyamophila willieti]